MLSGGGTGKLFAAIGVTYPAGSTLTCTSQQTGKQFKAKPQSEDNTNWVFAIPEPKTLPETWIVTATLGTNSKSQSVSITKEGQVESLELNYMKYLIKDGVDITEVTGGWKVLKQGNLVPTFGTENGAFYFKPTYGSGVAKIGTSKPVDFSKYSTLYFDIQGASDNYGTCALHTEFKDGSTYIAESRSMDTTRKTVSIPLDTITSTAELYVVLGERSLSNMVYIYNLWAE